MPVTSLGSDFVFDINEATYPLTNGEVRKIGTEYYVLYSGINMPSQGGTWIFNTGADTDHETYLTASHSIRVKGTINRANLLTFFRMYVRLLDNGVVAWERALVPDIFPVNNGIYSFRLDDTSHWNHYPDIFLVNGQRFLEGHAYQYQVRFEELLGSWTGSVLTTYTKVGETPWVSSTTMKVRVKQPHITVNAPTTTPIYVRGTTLNIAAATDVQAYMGIRTDYLFGLGGPSGADFEPSVIISPTLKTSHTYVLSGTEQKMRFGLAAKSEFGKVSWNVPLRDVIFDMQPPVVAWGAPIEGLITRTATLDLAKVSVSDYVSGVDVSSIAIKNHAFSPVAQYSVTMALGVDNYTTGQIALKEGENTLECVASDKAGNTRQVPRKVYLDTVPPYFTSVILNAMNSSGQMQDMALSSGMTVYSPSITLKVVGGDVTSGVASYKVWLNGNEIGAAAKTYSPPSGNISCSDSISLNTGTNRLTVKATDAAGNIGTLALGENIVINYQPYNAGGPQVGFTSPADGQWFGNATIPFTGTCSDPDGVVSVVLKAYLSTNPTSPCRETTCSVVGNSWSGTLSGLAQGQTTVKAIAQDGMGLTSEAVLSVNVDTSPPEVRFDPVIATVVTQSQINISTTAIESISYLTRGILQVTFNGNTTTIFDESFTDRRTADTRTCSHNLEPGTSTISVKFYDVAGNMKEETTSVLYNKISSSDPQITITPPADTIFFAAGVDFGVNISAEQNLTEVRVDFYPQKTVAQVNASPLSGFYQIDLRQNTGSDTFASNYSLVQGMMVRDSQGNVALLTADDFRSGYFVLRVRAFDGSRSGDKMQQYRIDTTKPSIVKFNPLNGSTNIAPSVQPSVQFSVGMDINTVAASLNGAYVGGQWSWTNNDTVMTYTHGEPFPMNSVITVNVTSGQDKQGRLLSTDQNNSATFTIAGRATVEYVRVGGEELVAGYVQPDIQVDGAVLEVGFSAEMDHTTIIPNLSLRLEKANGSMVFLETAEPTLVGGKTVVRNISTGNQLDYETTFTLVITSAITDKFGSQISEERRSFSTIKTQIELLPGYTVTFTPGENGFAYPLEDGEPHDDMMLRRKLDEAFGMGSVGRISWYDQSQQKWVSSLVDSGCVMKSMLPQESVWLRMGISSNKTQKFVGNAYQGGRVEFVLNPGLNCISLPVEPDGITNMMSLAKYFMRQGSLSKIAMNMIRKKGNSQEKTFIGYAYVDGSQSTPGLSLTGNQRVGGDAIIVVVSSPVTIVVTGKAWRN